MTPFQRILLALFLGISLGIFLGDYAAPLRLLGDIYIGLLQMTVLPFIVCSIIGNIGHLTLAQSKRLAVTGFSILLFLWVVGFAALFLLAQALPDLPSGSFFSTSLIEHERTVDLLGIFLPSNPFRSLSENLVPGVVVFCMFVGFALMQTPNNGPILSALDVLNETLGRVGSYVARLSPIGVFAISASAAGSLTLDEFGRLQAYFAIYSAAVLLLVIFVLPLLVSAMTPFTYREIISTQGSVLVTALAIGSVFAVIPMLIESQKTLMAKLPERGVSADAEALNNAVEFMVPMAYPFPHLGKIVTLIFIPFAAWFYGQSLDLGEYTTLFAAGGFLSFGKVTVTVPFLLDLFELPSDIFRLFLLSSVIAGPLSDLLGAAHLLAFSTLVTCAMHGALRIGRVKLAGTVVVCFLVAVAVSSVTRYSLGRLTADAFSRENVIASMGLLESRAPNTILAVSEPNPDALLDGESYSDRMERRGIVRVGFLPDNLPYSYYNARGNLVGHDIDLVHRFAKDFGLEIEFVPYWGPTLMQQYDEDHFDIAVSGLEINLGAGGASLFSLPYSTAHFAFVAPDYDREQFETITGLEEGEGLTIGVKTGSYYEQFLRRALPKARIVELLSDSQFFEGPPEPMDALATSAEVGSAWTLIHPTFAVIDPRDDDTSLPLAFLRRRDDKIENGLDTWFRLKRHEGTLDSLFEFWILGVGAVNETQRWSVIRNVLKWVD
ncbi:MAG: cation:dicarboxylate symporter family transporter [Boseongicola sp.]